MAEQDPTQDVPQQVTPRSNGSLLSHILVVGFMCLVVLGECAAAYFFIPGADEVAARAQAKAGKELETPETTDDDSGPAKEEERVIEVDLGDYSITAHQPSSSTNLRIDFHLFATVMEQDESGFSALFARNQHRIRDQIIFEIRNSDLTDLTDPGLGLIKRRILEKSNMLFGRHILRSVVVSDFSLVEQ